MIKLIVKIFFIFVLTISFLHAHSNKKKSLKSHEHGVGTLNIAQDENTIIFEFEIPGSDIVGFEYLAKEEEDIKKVKDAIDILSDYKNMILPSGAGKCKLLNSSAKVINEGKHSEFLSNYKFNCENLAELKIIYIRYFKNFENGRKLNIKIFGENKKSAYVISKTKKIINIKGHF